MSDPAAVPDTYRLLAHFSGQPALPIDVLRRAGFADERGRPTRYGRGVLGSLRSRGLLRWVRWAEPKKPGQKGPPTVYEGLVLTGTGETVLRQYFDRYGPALPEPPEDEP